MKGTKNEASSLKKNAKSRQKQQKSFQNVVKGKLCFAFDFGEYAIKIVVAKMSKGAAEIKHFIVIENDDRKLKMDRNNLKEWRSKINHEFNKRNINPSGHFAVCTTGSRNYISRQMDIQFAADSKDREGLVAYEMSQSLSLDVNAYVFQHKVLGGAYETNGVKMCPVFAAAISKENCDVYFDLVDSLKLKPLIMDINVNGLERLFAADQHLKQQTANRAVAVVDYGMRGTEVSIFKDGNFLMGTTMDRGDAKLVSAAKNVLGPQITDIHNENKLIIKPQTVCNILHDAKTVDTAGMFLNVVETWLEDVNAIIKRYNLDHASEQVSHIFLYGGSLQLFWLMKYLEGYTNVPVSIIQSINCNNALGRVENNGNTVPQFLNAVNLLLMD